MVRGGRGQPRANVSNERAYLSGNIRERNDQTLEDSPRETQDQNREELNAIVIGSRQIEGMRHQTETPILFEITDHPICTYASLVDPAEGIALKYIPTAEINRQKYVKIDKTNVVSEVEYWSVTVIYGVVRANPLVEVVEGYVRRIWSRKSIDKVVMARKGSF